VWLRLVGGGGHGDRVSGDHPVNPACLASLGERVKDGFPSLGDVVRTAHDGAHRRPFGGEVFRR